MRNDMTYDAIVVGGGIVGMSIGYHLACAGARALLIDRADAGRATDAGAGILAPETNSRDAEAWFAFASAAVGYYPELIRRLSDEQAGETGYAICGQLIVAATADEDAPFAEARRIVFERQRRRGAPSAADLQEVTPDDARALFPPLAQVRGALYFRNAARVDGRLLTAALRRAALARGLTIQPASVERLETQSGAATGVVAGGAIYAADTIALATGAWSQSFAEQIGASIPIQPQRGQIIHLSLPGAETGDWPVVMGFHGHYMVAWPDSRVVVGATRETGAGFAPHTTAAGVREVLDEALRVAPGLASAEMREIRVGLRPASPDSLPLLGAAPAARNLYLAAGHGPTGLQLGPYSGKLVADLMLGRAIETDISALDVTRFS
jgi:glycine/D-amino acid oxidase-like deaminating enzyme